MEHNPEYDTSTFAQPTLPSFSATPTVHPGCCLALSTNLITQLHTLLPAPPRLTLSIGSGYGLLEALLVAPPYSLHLLGVEVQPSPNRYLPPSHHCSVSGTRFLHPLAAEAAAWLLVYPRRAGMVAEYMAEYGEGRVETVVWVGPRADWEDYKACFDGRWDTHVKIADDVGGRACELIAVARKIA